jgi:hypothetical protein
MQFPGQLHPRVHIVSERCRKCDACHSRKATKSGVGEQSPFGHKFSPQLFLQSGAFTPGSDRLTGFPGPSLASPRWANPGRKWRTFTECGSLQRRNCPLVERISPLRERRRSPNGKDPCWASLGKPRLEASCSFGPPNRGRTRLPVPYFRLLEYADDANSDHFRQDFLAAWPGALVDVNGRGDIEFWLSYFDHIVSLAIRGREPHASWLLSSRA